MKSTQHATRVERPSDRLLELAAGYEKLIVMTHDNPDPDGIASGWAIVHLLKVRLGREASFVAAGGIVRAENRKLVELLCPPLTLGEPILPPKNSLVIFVDCDVDSTNHPRVGSARQAFAVIDHHQRKGAETSVTVFRDRRPGAAATASIAASYLKEQGLSPPVKLATAMVYGIRTETKAGETTYSELDRSMLGWLSHLSNPSYLAKIEDAPLSRAYFSDLSHALNATVIYGDTAFCILPQSQGPEIVGEVADLLARCKGIKSVFCGAVHRGNLVVSVRSRDARKSAARAVVRVLCGIGHGGGHVHRAGGIVRNLSSKKNETEKILRVLKRRWLMACGVRARRGTSLVRCLHSVS